MTRIVEEIRKERDTRRVQPPKAGPPDHVPFALSRVVERCGAKDKNQAKRAMDALLEAGEIRLAHTCKPRGKRFGLRCYELLEQEAA